jgi:hypothetical protein
MGTSVTTELLARDLDGQLPFDLRRVVLSNGSVILERASLRPIQKVLRGPLGPIAARLVSRGGFKRGFGRLFSPDHPLSAEEAHPVRRPSGSCCPTTTATASRIC